jgi:hypothetical protein
MSWANIRELIFQERKILDPVTRPHFQQESPFETQYSALLGHYLKTKAQIDATARCFAQTLEWPEMSEVEKFFIAARLDFAWEIASILNTFHGQDSVILFPAPTHLKTPELIEWLLIDIWPYGCTHFFQKQRLAGDAVGKRAPLQVAAPTVAVA